MRLRVMPIGFLAILIIVLLVVVLVAVFRRNAMGKTAFLIPLAVIVSLGIAFLVGVVFMLQPRRVSVSDSDMPIPTVPLAIVEAGSPGPWALGGDELFEPDIYPSKRVAMHGLAWRVGRKLDELVPQGVTLQEIRVIDGTGELLTLLEGVAEKLRDYSDGLRVVVADTRGGDGVLNISIPKPASYSRGGNGALGRKVKGGTIKMVVKCSRFESVFVGEYVEKGWVDDIGDFYNRHPGRVWMVAQSSRPCSTQAEANEQALSDAVNKLGMSDILARRRHGRNVTWQEIKGKLIDCGVICDEFVQRFNRPYGDIWRHAILLDAPPDKLRLCQRMLQKESAAGKMSFLRSSFSAAAILGAVCVLYFCLNLATKGYYTWWLRIGLILLLGSGVALVLYL